MTTSEGSLGNQIMQRRPLDSDGNSGNTLESVTLSDGRNLILKRVSPEWDWMARETHDGGRLAVASRKWGMKRAVVKGAGGTRRG